MSKSLLDVRLLPLLATALSFVGLAVSVYRHSRSSDTSNATRRSDVYHAHRTRPAGRAIARCKIVKVMCAVALLALCAYTELVFVDGKTPLVRAALIGSTVYAAVLSIISVFTPSSAGLHLQTRATAVLLALLVPYLYRDVWPLLTLTLHPLDAREGLLLWAKVALCFVASVGVPLLQPFEYVPADPANPQEELNPEQTASIVSRLTYAFLNPLLARAAKQSTLGEADLPPLADVDLNANLVRTAYPYLDRYSGAQERRGLFWGLCRVFRRTLVLQAGILLVHGPFRVLVSVGINRLLWYLETGGKGALVRPWVWLFLTAVGGEFMSTVTNNYFLYLASTMLVRIQAILTTLLFDHALRARLVSEPATSTLASSSASVIASASGADTPGPPASDAQPTGAPGAAHGEVGLAARLADLATADLTNVLGGHQFLTVLLDVPLELALGLGFLYFVLGWSAFVGLAVMIALIPLPAWLSARMAHMQAARMAATDARVGALTEALSAMRMLKLFACTSHVRAQIADKREAELRIVWKLKLVEAFNRIVSFAIPLAHLCVSFAFFTLVQKRELTPSIVFSAIGAFDEIQVKIVTAVRMSPALVRAWVSLRRVETFLNETEVLDAFSASAPPHFVVSAHPGRIGLARATFAWSAREAGLGAAGRFQLRIDDTLEFRRGALNLVLGPTGSGKSALLLALLGELHYVPHSSESWCSLPREGGVALAAQESWVMSDTIRNNVVFGADWDEARYRKVLYQCALVQDIGMFEAGDATEVGEKGLTLSGGQKARVTLARAIYSQASTLLLDDVLAALDVRTARWIVDKCLNGDLVRGRTVILVTHHIALVKSLAQFVVSLTGDGHIATQGSLNQALAYDHALAAEAEDEKKMLEFDEIEDILDTDKPIRGPMNGKLTVAEEVTEGHVGWDSWRLFLRAVGGRWPFFFFPLAMSGATLREIGYACQIWWLGVFAQAYARMPASEVNVSYYLGVYFAITAFVLCCVVYGRMGWAWGTFHASREIHDKLVTAVMGTTFRWLDETPSSRIQARFTRDIQAVDESFPFHLNNIFETGISMAIRLCGVCVVTPTALLPGMASALVGGFVAQYFVQAQLAVKRELSVATAPILATFSSSVSGLASIRAYGFQGLVRQELMNRTDRYTSASRTFNTLDKWVGIRVDAIGTVFILAVTSYLVYGAASVTPAKIGFALDMAFGFQRLIFWIIIEINATQVESNSLERVQAYLDAPQERRGTAAGLPPAAWPISGDLRIESLSARYSEAPLKDGPVVLKDISLHVKSGERVGIVGRTGSGKSTLTLALLHAIITEGSVYYDGVKTSSVNLEELRSKVTVIPQVPELLNGTLRHTLDMFGEHNDVVLNSALQAAGLFALQDNLGERGLNLDSQIAAGGANLSIGQRQVIALARAIVRQSKLVILDEATSAIDHETDAHIQESLKTQLGNDVTVLIVAHRLRTIADANKILVLDAGRLIEFGSPRELLIQQGSVFRALVDESADRDTLHALIR